LSIKKVLLADTLGEDARDLQNNNIYLLSKI